MTPHEIESRIRVLRQHVERTAESGALRKAVKQAIAGMSAIEADIPDEPPVVVVPQLNGEIINGIAQAFTGGIRRDNNVRVSVLSLVNCNVETAIQNAYGIYLSPCDLAMLQHCHIESAYYAVRGTFKHWESYDSTFIGSHAWRVYGLHGGISARDTFRVERLMLGGGAADEAIDPQPFENFIFDGCTIDTRRPSDIYPASHHITFRNCNFVNAGVSIWGGAHDIVFENCTVGIGFNARPLKESDIKLGKDPDGVQWLTWNNAHERGIVIR